MMSSSFTEAISRLDIMATSQHSKYISGNGIYPLNGHFGYTTFWATFWSIRQLVGPSEFSIFAFLVSLFLPKCLNSLLHCYSCSPARDQDYRVSGVVTQCFTNHLFLLAFPCIIPLISLFIYLLHTKHCICHFTYSTFCNSVFKLRDLFFCLFISFWKKNVWISYNKKW